VHAAEPLDVVMAEVAAALTAPVKASDACRLITEVAVDSLAGVDFASIWLAQGRQSARIVATTDPRGLEADRLQHELSEGPCLDVMETLRTVRSPDVATDSRWPLYGPKVAASGVVAQTSLPLPGSRNVRACLNLYALTTGPVGGPHVVAGLFATHAAVALSYSLQLHDISAALDRRKVIGQAIGIVMERYAIDEEAAFAFLTRASQTANVKLRSIAEQIVSGVVDDDSQRRS